MLSLGCAGPGLLTFFIYIRSPPLGSHSLQYFSTIVSRPGLMEPEYTEVSYVDDTQFIRCNNSETETLRAKPRVPWVEQEGPEYWERQTRIFKEHTQNFRT